MTSPPLVAHLSCGHTTTEWDPPEESWGGRGDLHHTRCDGPGCRGQRRLVRAVRPADWSAPPACGDPGPWGVTCAHDPGHGGDHRDKTGEVEWADGRGSVEAWLADQKKEWG
jgi:hypothetical protein